MPLKVYEKEKILDACFEVFVLNGYGKTSTAMLAEAAGISKALIFHHFGSKKKLYFAILERCFDKMAPDLDQDFSDESGNFFEAKERSGKKTIEYMRKNPKLNMILFEAFYSTPDELKSEIPLFKASLEKKYGAHNSERENRMMDLFRKIPLRPSVDSGEAYELIHIVSEYFRMKLASEIRDPEKINDDRYWEDFFKKKKAFLDMVRFGIEPGP